MYLVCHTGPHVNTTLRGHVNFWIGAPCGLSPPLSLVTISTVIMEIMFLVCQTWPLMNTFLKGYVNLWLEVPHRESLPCHVWWPLVQFKWKYEVFNISCNLAKSREWGFKWLYGWQLFMVCHYLAKFGGHCSCRDMFLVCYVIKQNHVIKGWRDDNDRSPWIKSSPFKVS